MGIIRKVFKFVLWIVAILLVVVLTLPLWVGPVVKGVANWKVPQITGTGFHLGEFGLNPYTGTFHVGDMQLQNPKRFFTDSEKTAKGLSEVETGDGFLSAARAHAENAVAAAGDALAAVGDVISSSETNAVKFKSIDVKYSTLSAFTKTVKIEEIVIDGLYFYGDLTFSNIREIKANATKGGDAEKPAESSAAESETENSANEEGKKVQIGRVLITGTKIQWGHAAISLPDIEIKDIGKEEEGGAGADEVSETILDSICAAADKACAGAGSALEAAIEGAGKAKEAVGKIVDGATDAVSGALDSASGAVSGALDSAGDALDKGLDAVKGLNPFN